MGLSTNFSATLHHAHLLATDLERSLAFYREMFGAEIVFEGIVAGARNVLLKLGDGHINFYDQPPKDAGRGAVHHLGIRTNDLRALVAHMQAKGFEFPKGIREFEAGRYVMAMAPDGVLLEIFETRSLLNRLFAPASRARHHRPIFHPKMKIQRRHVQSGSQSIKERTGGVLLRSSASKRSGQSSSFAGASGSSGSTSLVSTRNFGSMPSSSSIRRPTFSSRSRCPRART